MDNELRVLVDLRDRVLQKNRIAFDLRVQAIERGADDGDTELLIRWKERFQDMEDEADKDIRKMAKKYDIIRDMVEVRGLAWLLSAKVVSMIDISRANTVSALWRYCGYAVIDGKRERPTKGVKLPYNQRLKTTCYLVGSSFLRSSSPYRKVYDAAREYYAANRLDWTDGHQHNAAMRKMVKLWLSHLWLRWRQLEGLPISGPYVHAKLAHKHVYTPEQFGWQPFIGSNPT